MTLTPSVKSTPARLVTRTPTSEGHFFDPAPRFFDTEVSAEPIASHESKPGPTEYANGDRLWRLNGKFHREDGPAKEFSDGNCEWWIDGKLHRENGPAVVKIDGYRAWYLNGKRHRVRGPAIEDIDGYKEWYLNGRQHREDGPALEQADGSKFWYRHGKKHREDGPAVEWVSGKKEWWHDGVEVPFCKTLLPKGKNLLKDIDIRVQKAIGWIVRTPDECTTKWWGPKWSQESAVIIRRAARILIWACIAVIFPYVVIFGVLAVAIYAYVVFIAMAIAGVNRMPPPVVKSEDDAEDEE